MERGGLPDPTAHPLSTPFRVVVVMGVSACGKSIVGETLADCLGGSFLDGPRELLMERLEARATQGGHFMPASLLDSQLETLESPEGEEITWCLEIHEAPEQIVVVERATASLTGGLIFRLAQFLN